MGAVALQLYFSVCGCWRVRVRMFAVQLGCVSRGQGCEATACGGRGMDFIGVLCRCLSPERCGEHMHGNERFCACECVGVWTSLLYAARALECRSERYNAYGCGGRTGSFSVKMLGASVSGSVHPHCVIVKCLFLEQVSNWYSCRWVSPCLIWSTHLSDALSGRCLLTNLS